ncbi:MAG: hypothetical protein U0169_23215 [Polyangiaceae bacterium]
MKTPWILAVPACALLVACAGSQDPAKSASDTTVTTTKPSEIPAAPATTAKPPQPTALLPQAPEPMGPAALDVLDPLAVNGALEESTVPKVVLTPAKDVKKKSRFDLDGALSAAKSAKTVDEASSVITKRVGKPSYVEAEGQRRVWIAPDGTKCHRLVLDSDGSLELETAASNEWKSLSMAAKQKLCSGEIKKGSGKE